MTWITEEPIYIFMTGLLFVVGLGATAFVIGKKWLWALSVLFFVLMVILLVLESRIVTDREKLNLALDEMIVCVRNNDLEGLLSHVSMNFPETKDYIRSEVKPHKVQSASIMHRQQPEINDSAVPKTAVMMFTGVGQVETYETTIFRGVTLTFQKDPDDEWRVMRFEHYSVNPLGGARQ